jgi:hypothetical protein
MLQRKPRAEGSFDAGRSSIARWKTSVWRPPRSRTERTRSLRRPQRAARNRMRRPMAPLRKRLLCTSQVRGRGPLSAALCGVPFAWTGSATSSDPSAASISRRRARPDDAGGLNVNPPSPISNEYLEAILQESSAGWECRHRAMAAQVYPGIMPDDLFPIPSPRVDQPDNQGPEGTTP